MDKLTNATLFNTVKGLIQASKQHVAVSVNAEMSMLYWKIGTVIHQEILKEERAEYGRQRGCLKKAVSLLFISCVIFWN
jgi:hypothetical protein